MARLHLMMGVPGSGKTTWCKAHMKDGDRYVSRDEVRFSMVSEDEEYFSKEKEVFRKYTAMINTNLKMGYDVFADATHLNAASRNKLLRNINVTVDGIDIIWLKTSLEESLKRNSQREGRAFVPVSQIRRMNFSIEEPTFEEGFDKIYIVEDGKPIQIKEKR